MAGSYFIHKGLNFQRPVTIVQSDKPKPERLFVKTLTQLGNYRILQSIIDDFPEFFINLNKIFFVAFPVVIFQQGLTIFFYCGDTLKVFFCNMFNGKISCQAFYFKPGPVYIHHVLEFYLSDHGAGAGDNPGHFFPFKSVQDIPHGGSTDAEFLGQHILIQYLAGSILKKEDSIFYNGVYLFIHSISLRETYNYQGIDFYPQISNINSMYTTDVPAFQGGNFIPTISVGGEKTEAPDPAILTKKMSEKQTDITSGLDQKFHPFYQASRFSFKRLKPFGTKLSFLHQRFENHGWIKR